MPGLVWGEDAPADGSLLKRNIRAVLDGMVQAVGVRAAPTVAMAHDWHRSVYEGVSSVPAPHFLGGVRGSAHPDLSAHSVAIGDGLGRVVARTPPPSEVPGRLAALEAGLQTAVGDLDRQVPAGTRPGGAELEAVVMLCAVLHGEWVLLHPYANGNGRTARLWANWAALRYGLPPFVRIKPRPDGLLYPRAAASSMGSPPSWQGDHQLTYSLFLDLLRTPP